MRRKSSSEGDVLSRHRDEEARRRQLVALTSALVSGRRRGREEGRPSRKTVLRASTDAVPEYTALSFLLSPSGLLLNMYFLLVSPLSERSRAGWYARWRPFSAFSWEEEEPTMTSNSGGTMRSNSEEPVCSSEGARVEIPPCAEEEEAENRSSELSASIRRRRGGQRISLTAFPPASWRS